MMRAVFQTQPDVAHVYLGSKRSMMHGLFNDANEPFWRSAKQLELGVIAPEDFAPSSASGSRRPARRVDQAAVDGVLSITRGHPYATQELCYALWEETGPRREYRRAPASSMRRSNACYGPRTRTSR